MVLSSPYITKEEQEHLDNVAKLKAVSGLLAQMTQSQQESPETMSTIKQIEANRRNALKSTGPKSAQGKAAVAQNALTHGLYASTLLLPEEDPAQYAALCQLHVDEYQPEGLEQIDLVQSIVAGKWELARINLMKQGVYLKARKWLKRHDKKGEETHPSAVHLCMQVGADDDCSKAMARISQMEGRIQRQCERSRRELRKLQQERANQPQPEPDPPAAAAPQPEPPEPAATPAPTPQPANGHPAHPPARDIAAPKSGPSGG